MLNIVLFFHCLFSLSTSAQTSSIAPATRLCITSTPLCPLASFALCNVARITNTSKVLDPYSGSCTTLLAAAMIAPHCATVGIEIAKDDLVNRTHIQQDFKSRNLTLPQQLLYGDLNDPQVRVLARQAVGNLPFDAIIADPPYGIRESSHYSDNTPIEDLFLAIAHDKKVGHPLLRQGGRLVAFVPVSDTESLSKVLPNKELTEAAGLQFEVCKEQLLNDHLSRWLVSFVSIR